MLGREGEVYSEGCERRFTDKQISRNMFSERCLFCNQIIQIMINIRVSIFIRLYILIIAFLYVLASMQLSGSVAKHLVEEMDYSLPSIRRKCEMGVFEENL